MDVAEGLPEEFALLRRELAGILTAVLPGAWRIRREAALSLAALGLMCAQGSLSAIYRFGGTPPSYRRDRVWRVFNKFPLPPGEG